MEKWLALSLCAVMLLGAGCAYQAAAGGRRANAYAVYFREADLSKAAGGDALRTERAYLTDGISLSQRVEALMEALLEGPEDAELKNPIPAGTILLSAAVEDGNALVDLSAPYGTLSGVGLTLADYAITLTLTQLPEISSVTITVRGQGLAYRDQQTFTAEDVLLSSKEDVVSTVAAALYFLDADGVLVPEMRTLNLYEGDTQAIAVARALEAGPEDQDLFPVLPEGIRVKAIWLEGDVCFVNLPSALLSGLPENVTLPKTLQALRRSLESLDTVSEVRFLVDGETVNAAGQVIR